MIKKYWDKFNIITRDHFYHSGGKIENRNTVVEALVCNFKLNGDIKKHNHESEKVIQTSIFEFETDSANAQASTLSSRTG